MDPRIFFSKAFRNRMPGRIPGQEQGLGLKEPERHPQQALCFGETKAESGAGTPGSWCKVLFLKTCPRSSETSPWSSKMNLGEMTCICRVKTGSSVTKQRIINSGIRKGGEDAKWIGILCSFTNSRSVWCKVLCFHLYDHQQLRSLCSEKRDSTVKNLAKKIVLNQQSYVTL